MSTTRLLVVKKNDKYLRFTETGFEVCQMNKASVYPLSEEHKVTELCRQLKDIVGLKIMKLTIIEEFSGVEI